MDQEKKSLDWNDPQIQDDIRTAFNAIVSPVLTELITVQYYLVSDSQTGHMGYLSQEDGRTLKQHSDNLNRYNWQKQSTFDPKIFKLAQQVITARMDLMMAFTADALRTTQYTVCSTMHQKQPWDGHSQLDPNTQYIANRKDLETYLKSSAFRQSLNLDAVVHDILRDRTAIADQFVRYLNEYIDKEDRLTNFSIRDAAFDFEHAVCDVGEKEDKTGTIRSIAMLHVPLRNPDIHFDFATLGYNECVIECSADRKMSFSLHTREDLPLRFITDLETKFLNDFEDCYGTFYGIHFYEYLDYMEDAAKNGTLPIELSDFIEQQEKER